MQKLSGLYVITDEHLITEKDFSQTVELALQGGASIVQYRDKSNNREKRRYQANALRELCNQYCATLIINDDIQLAIETDADGVHIGSNDESLANAREQLGENKIIGVSCYDNFSLALTAEQTGANYVAFGSFYLSSIKPDAKKADTELLKKAREQLQIPVCAIGGINSENAALLIDAGADMLAVITDIFTHEDPKTASKNISKQFY
ncbi:MAG: thiamine phosphate synthase [Gammaproteobacteria bacterium]|nr:thiamine phosphate synthase [Gammaproteobacteria bacterium]MCW8910175.1 thiamine phosphate synthase [Gammaproteobacteria bacterium]MCW9006071.1 thiamine phosphate synthase [Gammaproteobacteria bacterium]MCW9056293.1 thiamine phosphate synthase [Gammaproteobacteria bacterium]